ncbi:MAG: outer membrane beta-barrel domain-containing protein [Bdellovibrionota bacterium]
MKINALIIMLLLISNSAMAQSTTTETTTPAAANDSLLKDFDSLSGNDVLMDRGNVLSPEIKTQIVQNRIVKRIKRFEFNPQYSNVFGGNPYVNTNMLGLATQFHFNYRWSLGLRYDYAFNELNNEGKTMAKQRIPVRDSTGTIVGFEPTIPAVDFIKQSYMATVNWYPIYGKFSLYDMGVVHFDAYALAGGGQVELASGNSDALTAGAGMAFWFSQHLTSRIEVRWMGYEAQPYVGKNEDVDLTMGTLSLGYLL